MTAEGSALLNLIADHLPVVREGAQEHDRSGAFPVETFATFSKNGVMGGTVPKDLGGLEVTSLHDVAVVLSRVAEADASTALALHAQFSRGLTFSYEWRHGTPAAQLLAERVLRRMAAGDPVCGGVKDHPSRVTTLSPDGTGGWLLSGRTTMVTMAPIARQIIVIAQTRADGQPPMLVAPVLTPQTPGVTVLDNWDGIGMRASGSVDIIFDNCPVPDEDVLLRGPVGGHSDVALAGQTVSSITMLGIYVGIAQAAHDVVIATVGQAADLPSAMRTLVAEMEARLYALRAIVGAALADADIANADLRRDPAERGRQMMRPFQCAKLMVNRLAPAIVDDGLTLVGGASYSASHPLSRLYRDVRAGGFMQPYNYVDAVDFLSAQALGIDRGNDYLSARATRASTSRETTTDGMRRAKRDAS